MAERACVYSVLVGGYERVIEQIVAPSSSLDFILFTDDPELTSDSWQVRHEPLVLPQDPARSSRRAKLLPHVALPDYDVSLYVDNRVLLRQMPEVIIEKLLPGDATFVVNEHDHRDTLRDEFEAVVQLGKDASWVCAEQLAAYEAQQPAVLDTRPIWTGFMLRRHHDERLVRANETWWTHLLRYSRRDQLSVLMALAEAGLEPRRMQHRNAESEFHEWLAPGRVERVEARGGAVPVMTELDECRKDRPQLEKGLSEVVRAEASATRRVQALETETAALRQARSELVGSTSWRITAPLRWAGDRMRRRS